jgi:tetratricopeptide (TPR) repeat protein
MAQGLRRSFELSTGIVLIATCAVQGSALPRPQNEEHRTPTGTPASVRAAELRARGLSLGFNLDHQEALETFKAAIEADPEHPTAYRLYAATLWIQLLFQQGAVTAEDYLGQTRSEVVRTPPPPAVDAEFRSYLAKALALGEKRARQNPADPDARFHIGAAQGFLTSYQATVEGRVIGGFKAARRAYKEHARVLELDPARADAGLIVGMYRYGVSTLSAPLRLLAGIAGFGGGKERGLRLIEQAAAMPNDVQTNALFSLIVIYTREARYEDAAKTIARLQQMYPRNRLLWLEAGSTAMRAGRPAEARAAIETGLAMLSKDPRARAFGEEARWRYHYGAALVALRNVDAADRELRASLAGEAPAWLRGRTSIELGKIADLAGRRAAAIQEYRRAERSCRAADDRDGVREAARLIRTPYR